MKQEEIENLIDDVKAHEAATLALFKLLATFPWLAEVADYGYDPEKAKEILIREADLLRGEE